MKDLILNYNNVLLFGPTNTKKELFNTIEKNHRFANIKIEIKEAGKMNLNQKTYW